MLKNLEDLNLAIETLTKVMQQATLQSTMPLAPPKCMNNTPLEIKQLLREKRKEKVLWQRTHFPTNKTRYNQLIS
jgi:predicted phosphohydrolase